VAEAGRDVRRKVETTEEEGRGRHVGGMRGEQVKRERKGKREREREREMEGKGEKKRER